MRERTEAVGKAHAKVILLGEHFVVPFTDGEGATHPGSNALAVPLSSLHTEVRLTLDAKSSYEIRCESGAAPANNAIELMEQAVRFAANRFQWNLSEQPLRASSYTNFSSSRGLGSSASFSVSLARAFAELKTRADAELGAEAQQIENLFHGKSSGLDTSVIFTGKPVLYGNGRVEKTFRPLATDFVVADSGPRDSCANLVSRTQELRKTHPALWTSLQNRINELVRECLSSVELADGATRVADAIRNAQEILAQIGLMNSQLSELLALGKRAGALAGKLSGAGTGGVALFVTEPGNGKAVSRRLAEAGAEVVAVVESEVVST